MMWRRPSVRFGFLTLVALLCMAVTAALGVWQLDRARQKQTLQDRIETRAGLPPVALAELLAPADKEAIVHRTVLLNGHWVQGATVFLDNRTMAGRTGFLVLTPLRLQGLQHSVLVQRGWVPRDFLDRDRLPEVVTPSGDVQLRGRLAPPPSKLLELGPGAAGPIRQNVDLSALADEWGLPLLEGLSVLQTDADDSGLLRDWPRFTGTAHKHRAYAAQWFAMSAIVAGLYLWFQIILPRSRRRTHGQDPR
jgi:surfeit locus 1 family protein